MTKDNQPNTSDSDESIKSTTNDASGTTSNDSANSTTNESAESTTNESTESAINDSNTSTKSVTDTSSESTSSTSTTEPPVINASRCRKCGKYACTCQKRKSSCSTTGIAIFLSVIAIICSGTSIYLNLTHNNTQPLSFLSGTDSNSANFTSGSISEIAAKSSPSVVSITTETRTQGFFGQSSTATAAGTGFIISGDGYVLTNKHVIEDAENVSIVLDNGTTYKDVKLVGTDPLNDAAILKIENVSDLPTLKLGDSKTITVGQEVIAIGNALGLYQNTVTSGIISGTGRSLVASDSSGSSYEALNDMIQTDAAINQGNSGGPLVNAAGEVVGINTAVSTANDIGFAIPISSIKGIIKSVTETGTFKRAYLGVYYNNLTPESAKTYNLDVTSGAYIHNSNGNPVISGSAADKAGLKDGDVVIAVNGTKIGSAGSLASLLGEYTVGDTVQLTILRDGKEETVKVTLQEYEDPNKNSTSNH